jgi:hypothetical protein
MIKYICRSKMWWPEDTDTVEDTLLYNLSVQHSLVQHVHEPTRITDRSRVV